MNYKYSDLYNFLSEHTVLVVFLKKDGHPRCMLCTRCSATMRLCYEDRIPAFKGHDKRCSIDNGNIGVLDLMIGEPRSFNVDRILNIYDCGIISEFCDLQNKMEYTTNFEANWKEQRGDADEHAENVMNDMFGKGGD